MTIADLSSRSYRPVLSFAASYRLGKFVRRLNHCIEELLMLRIGLNASKVVSCGFCARKLIHQLLGLVIVNQRRSLGQRLLKRVDQSKQRRFIGQEYVCLLYTSDAADE